MPVWKTTPVDVTPEIILEGWSVRELPDGDRHFVGRNLTEHGAGRVSSKIIEFDPQTMCGKTRSGRVYKLSGNPGMTQDSEYTWNAWARMYDVTDYKDVSEEIRKQ